jgi:hypothetical protein
VWAYQRGITLHFIVPGKPTQNAFVERFNGRFREEYLDLHLVRRPPRCARDDRRLAGSSTTPNTSVRGHQQVNGKVPEEGRMTSSNPPSIVVQGPLLCGIAVFGLSLALGGCSGGSTETLRSEVPAATVAASPVELPIPVRVGMTWDESQPFLSKVKRIKNTRETPDRFTDIYRIGDQGYSLQFERPAEPGAGPYRLIHVDRAELPPDTEPIDLNVQLKRGMTMGDALPIMQKVGGHFVVETKDRFAAVLQPSDGTYRVTFDRPSNVGRPDVIADATPREIAMMGRIPLNALPEFTAYRITAVTKSQ